MPAKSAAQQKAAGAALSAKRGDTAKSSLKGAVIASSGYLGITKRGWMEAYVKMASDGMAARTWCDAYGHALVASGRVDFMIDTNVKRWDISSMSLIVREAGGAFTDFLGRSELGDNAISSRMASG